MVSAEEGPASAWSDPAEADRWTLALARIAERERSERGVDRPWSVTSGYGWLWANFAGMRVRIAGVGAEVSDEADLFELIDRWVAFELLDSEDSLLDRDREYMALWRSRLPDEKRIWEQAAETVFADVDPALNLHRSWEVVLQEDKLDVRWPRDDERQGVWSKVTFHPSGWTPPEPSRRPLLLPHFDLNTDTCGTSLFRPYMEEGISGLAEAVATIAEWLQEDIIEHTWAAWPKCPEHEHPLVLAGRDGTTWTCPTTERPVAEVGRLLGPNARTR